MAELFKCPTCGRLHDEVKRQRTVRTDDSVYYRNVPRCLVCHRHSAVLYRNRNRVELRNRRRNNVALRIKQNVSRRIREALKLRKGSTRTVELLGCSIQEYIVYLEDRFVVGMSWNNYGEWEIDHCIPLSAFDLTNKSERQTAFHFSNTQPMWLTDNRRKSNKVST